jgi:CheY-like chemotaxis protein
VRILLVDDHKDTNRVIQLFLNRQGYQVYAAHTMSSALALAAGEAFDLVISDIGLPDGSGLELMRRLRAEGPMKGIALSGYGMEEDIQRSIEVGFAEHLTKPVSAQKLQEVIQRLVSETMR